MDDYLLLSTFIFLSLKTIKHSLLFFFSVVCYKTYTLKNIYTETIKLCPLDVYVFQFQMYERISFKFSHYKI